MSGAAGRFLLGTWRSEKGTLMEITEVNPAQRKLSFTGTYQAFASNRGPEAKKFFSGVLNIAEEEGGTLAFAVNWNYSRGGEPDWCTMAWAGFARGREMKTKWILACFSDAVCDWKNVATGDETFTKL